MSNKALARKYRPRRFAEVATQEHVSRTLQRAVASGRVAHAYLFCGPRGIGKTTLARVLAMALNCPRRGEDGEPCGACESCERIWGGHTSLDVVEIDAASNRGVDDARDLRERAMYAPSDEGRHKVYIVDEAHMLTREAWNALLKVLEEPPPRVIFVFATTEPHKIQQAAAPILSRCQRFDFRRIGVPDIVARLEEVLSREQMAAPEAALWTIARKADGALRDALSLLDQVLAFTDGEVTDESVRSVLGLVPQERYLELFEIVLGKRHGDVFRFVEQLLEEGYDLIEFYHGLADGLRTLLRLRLDPADSPPDLRPDLVEAYAEKAARFEAGDLVRMLGLAADLETDGSLRKAAQPRILIEMLLLRYAYLERTVEVEELIRRLGSPEVVGTGGSGNPEAGRGVASPKASPARRESSAEPEVHGRDPGREARDTAPVAAATPIAPAASVVRASPEAPPAPRASEPRARLEAAWERMVEEGAGLPQGLKAFLRMAKVVPGKEGWAVVQMPPGPGLDRLQAVRVRAQVEAAFKVVLGADVRIAVEGVGEPLERLSGEAARRERLERLLAREPALGRAVEELDLELLDS